MQPNFVPCEICHKEHDRLDSLIAEDFTKTRTTFGPRYVVALCSEECRKKYLEQRDKFNEFLSMQPWG